MGCVTPRHRSGLLHRARLVCGRPMRFACAHWQVHCVEARPWLLGSRNVRNAVWSENRTQRASAGAEQPGCCAGAHPGQEDHGVACSLLTRLGLLFITHVCPWLQCVPNGSGAWLQFAPNGSGAQSSHAAQVCIDFPVSSCCVWPVQGWQPHT